MKSAIDKSAIDKSAIDWQTRYDGHPYVALGVALGGGLLIGGLLTLPRARSNSARRWRAALGGRAPAERHQLLRSCINIAVATYRVAETLYRVTPLLRDEFAALARSRRT